MYRGTTPTLPIRIKGVDLTEARLFLTIEGPKANLTLTTPRDFTAGFDGEDTVAEIFLTQQQTLILNEGDHMAQVRWINSEGVAGATKKMPISVEDVLLKGVIKYE